MQMFSFKLAFSEVHMVLQDKSLNRTCTHFERGLSSTQWGQKGKWESTHNFKNFINLF